MSTTRRTSLVRDAWLVVSFIVAGGYAPALAQEAGSTSILLTADTEGHVSPCTSCPGREGLGSLVRRATVVAELRGVHPESLLLDAGNALFGAESLASKGQVIVAAYDLLGYDAVHLTHRDFHQGKAVTLDLVRRAAFPFVSANLLDADTGLPLVRPYVVKVVGSERVAVIGVTQRPAALDCPRDRSGLRQQLAGIRIHPAADALASWLPRAKAEADRVVLLYYGSPFGLSKIRRQFSGKLDAICVGGTRPRHVPGDARPPVVATGSHGGDLAVTTLGVGTGVRQVNVPPATAPDPRMQELVAGYEEAGKPHAAAVRRLGGC